MDASLNSYIDDKIKQGINEYASRACINGQVTKNCDWVLVTLTLIYGTFAIITALIWFWRGTSSIFNIVVNSVLTLVLLFIGIFIYRRLSCYTAGGS